MDKTPISQKLYVFVLFQGKKHLRCLVRVLVPLSVYMPQFQVTITPFTDI